MLDRKHLPPQVYRTLENLQKTMHHVKERSANASEIDHRHRGSSSDEDADYRLEAHRHDRPRPSISSTTRDLPPRHNRHADRPDVGMMASSSGVRGYSSSRNDYEVDSVLSDDMVSRPYSASSSAGGAYPHEQRHHSRSVTTPVTNAGVSSLNTSSHGVHAASRYRALEGSSHAVQSSIGQRWKSTFMQMEEELLSSQPSRDAAASSAYPDPATSSGVRGGGGTSNNNAAHAARYTTTASSAMLPVATPSDDREAMPDRDDQISQRPPSGHRHHDMNILPKMENAASTVASLELDALRRQSGELAHLRIQLKDEQAAHEETVANLKLKHSREVEALTKEFRDAKERLMDEAYNRQLLSFQAKEDLLRVEMATLQKHIKDGEVERESLRMKNDNVIRDLQVALEQLQMVRGEAQRWQADVDRLTQDNAMVKRERSDTMDVCQERESELRTAKHREQMLSDDLHKHQLRVSQLEEAMRLLDLSSKEEMRKLEKEFSETNLQFEMLLNEAGDKAQKYERLKTKYKHLKDAASSKERELEASLQQASLLNRELQAELQNQEEQVRSARAEYARREHELREERSSHAELIKELESQIGTLQQSLEDNEATYRREQTNFEKASARWQQERQELYHKLKHRESECDTKAEAMQVAEEKFSKAIDLHKAEMSAKDEHYGDLVASLRRSLSEKERRIEQLVAVSAEPLQKLRKQLEDERTKRAQLEHQLEANKRLAREAEEEARRELKREQLRHPVMKTSSPAGFVSSAASASSHIPPTPFSAPSGGEESLARIAVLPQTTSIADNNYSSNQQVHVTVATAMPNRVGEPEPLAGLSKELVAQPYNNNNNNNNSKRTASTHSNVTSTVSVDAVPVTTSTGEGGDHVNLVSSAANQHEQRMAEFKSASHEVFERIMGSQQTFWQRCNDLVRAVPAARGLKASGGIQSKISGGGQSRHAKARGEQWGSDDNDDDEEEKASTPSDKEAA